MKQTLTLIGCFLLIGTAIAKEQPAVESTVLLKSTSSWDGTPYKAYPTGQPELTVLNIKIPPNSALKWHQHPIPNAAYVVSGQLEVQSKEGDKSIHLKAGDVLPEMVDTLHRGKTGDSPVELIVFYAGTPGTPLSK
jgi:quercetin dioxygenase-like cupin family protein